MLCVDRAGGESQRTWGQSQPWLPSPPATQSVPLAAPGPLLWLPALTPLQDEAHLVTCHPGLAAQLLRAGLPAWNSQPFHPRLPVWGHSLQRTRGHLSLFVIAPEDPPAPLSPLRHCPSSCPVQPGASEGEKVPSVD